MGQETVKHGLSRRQLIGSAAGTAAGAALATAGPLGVRAFADSDPSASDAHLPAWRIGFISYSTRGSNVLPGSASAAQRQQWTETLRDAGNNVVEVYGNNNWGFGSSATARQNMRQWCEDHDMEIVADHNGPSSGNGASPSTGNIESWINRCNDYGYRNLGQGGGWSGSNTVSNWMTQSQNANNIGQAMQTGTGGVDGLPGARWYGHNHWDEWAVIPAGNGEWSGRRYEEIALEMQDINYAFCEFDLAWLRAGVPNNQTWFDLGVHYSNEKQDGMVKVPLYHIKGKLATGTSGTDRDVNIPDDVLTTGSPNWKDFFEALEDPSAHTYLWERDNSLSVSDITNSIERFRALLHETELDRSVIGAPANVTPPAIVAPDVPRAGNRLRCFNENRGEWVRHPKAIFEFQWTRNGVAIPGADDHRYDLQPADEGKEVTVYVSARNPSGATPEPAPTVAVAGGGPQPTDPPTISGSGAPGTMLTCYQGQWDMGGTNSFQWYVDGVAVPTAGTGAGTTRSTNPKRFRCHAEWLGSTVTCRVTRTNNNHGATTVETNGIVVG